MLYDKTSTFICVSVAFSVFISQSLKTQKPGFSVGIVVEGEQKKYSIPNKYILLNM